MYEASFQVAECCSFFLLFKQVHFNFLEISKKLLHIPKKSSRSHIVCQSNYKGFLLKIVDYHKTMVMLFLIEFEFERQ